MSKNNKFILLHRAANNAPVIINCEHIMVVYKTDMEDDDGDYERMATAVFLDDCDDDEEQLIIFVNESVERVYNMINGISSKSKKNIAEDTDTSK